MKKLIPIILFVIVSVFGYQALAAQQLSSSQFVLLSAGLMVLLGLVFRPKGPKAVVNPQAVSNALGDFAADAFADDSKLSDTFRSAVKDYATNMPKSALNKLVKLAPQCRSDEEKYAVAMVSALCHIQSRDYEKAIKEYNRAVVIHPTSELAHTIGTCQQRMGELKKALDSYEFALELDPGNVEARSSMATAYVASRKYDEALEHAMAALELDKRHASSLATVAICYGIQDNTMLYKHYTDQAEAEGYSRAKIEDTVKALKK